MSIVVITGCSSGFGMLTALEFARRGDRVYATMRNTAKAGPLMAEAKASAKPVEVLPLDVNDPGSVSAAIDELIRREGRIDVLVNNAGIGIDGPVEEFDDDEAMEVFQTNFFGVVRVTRAVLPQMRKQRSGTIVMVSSLAGKASVPFEAIYGASKHALEGLSDALYYEVQPFGIRVVLIEPGGFETAIAENARNVRRFNESSPYWEAQRGVAAALDRLPGGWMRADAKIVADVIVDAAKAEQPQRRYLVGQDAELIAGLHKKMSDEEFEKAVRTLLDWH